MFCFCQVIAQPQHPPKRTTGEGWNLPGGKEKKEERLGREREELRREREELEHEKQELMKYERDRQRM